MWFQSIFGFAETPDNFNKNQSQFYFDADKWQLTSKANSATFSVGPFEALSIRSLVDRSESLHRELGDRPPTGLTFENIIGDVRTLIRDPFNNGSVFQVASQFNCLEMVGPRVTPDAGISGYSKDPTQGPACAIACSAATVYRNYFYNGTGQSRKQLDLLQRVGELVNNDVNHYWNMKNGYCLPASPTSMNALSRRLTEDHDLSRAVLNAVFAGIHWNTEVVCGHNNNEAGSSSASSSIVGNDDSSVAGIAVSNKLKVCQVFTSALPVAYSKSTPSKDWTAFAMIVLEAAFSAVLSTAHCLALAKSIAKRVDRAKGMDSENPEINAGNGDQSCPDASSDGNDYLTNYRVRVFLTPIGAGAFGNRVEWIISALGRALEKHRHAPIDVKLVHYGGVVKSAYNNINATFHTPRPLVSFKDERKRFGISDTVNLLQDFSHKWLPILNSRFSGCCQYPPVKPAPSLRPVQKEQSVQFVEASDGHHSSVSSIQGGQNEVSIDNEDMESVGGTESIISINTKPQKTKKLKKKIKKKKIKKVRSVNASDSDNNSIQSQAQPQLKSLSLTSKPVTSKHFTEVYFASTSTKKLSSIDIANVGICGVSCTLAANPSRELLRSRDGSTSRQRMTSSPTNGLSSGSSLFGDSVASESWIKNLGKTSRCASPVVGEVRTGNQIHTTASMPLSVDMLVNRPLSGSKKIQPLEHRPVIKYHDDVTLPLVPVTGLRPNLSKFKSNVMGMTAELTPIRSNIAK